MLTVLSSVAGIDSLTIAISWAIPIWLSVAVMRDDFLHRDILFCSNIAATIVSSKSVN